jgi:chromosome segregation ATPase
MQSLCIVKLVLHLSTACEGFDVTEIFLAYDSSDRNRARPVRDALVAQGFDVHWDQEAPAGVDWETWVRKRLAQSKCVIVLRSAASIHSNRMSHVAAVAEEHSTLVVVRLEPRSAWLAPGQSQGQGQGQGQAGAGTEGLDLANWRGDADHPGWQELCRRIEAKLKSSLWMQRLIHDVEAELARWRSQYETSAARCKALNEELAVERSERGAAQDKVAGLQAQLDADAKARFKLQSSIVELEQRLAGTSGKHAEARQLLSEELRQKAAQLTEAQAALTRQQDDTVRLRTELASAESARLELSARVIGHESIIKLRDAHIVDLDAKAGQRETEIAGLRTTITERDAEVSGLRATVAKRDAEVAGLRATIAQRDADVAGLRAAITDRNTDLGGLKSVIAQRDEGIAGLHADIAGLQANMTERDSYMADLEASVAQRDAYIAKLTANLAERRAYMADLEASIAQRDTHIADLKTSVAERDTQIVSLKTNYKELERRSQSRLPKGVPLPALNRATPPVAAGLAGVARSFLKMRQG